MKTRKTILAILFIGTLASLNAQEAKSETEVKTNEEKRSYYEQRGAEDANYELEFKAKSKRGEESFWNDQENYERELKEDNRRAYRAYMQGKKDAYAEHHDDCNGHHYHSDSFYQHAGFYYYEYDRRSYERRPSRGSSVNPQIGVSAPSVRLGLF
ncbi:hypothetical protein [Flavobacterium sp. W22_SRS_FP1]|uniref:hypothetical protein n=1 Tax=Flavobacterium sp. W22_SRS_FP1 TaxID=3240276 RepID=UPI003F90D417